MAVICNIYISFADNKSEQFSNNAHKVEASYAIIFGRRQWVYIYHCTLNYKGSVVQLDYCTYYNHMPVPGAKGLIPAVCNIFC